MSFPYNSRDSLGHLPMLTEAAGAIIDEMTSKGYDWRSNLDNSSFLESADWLTAVRYARAAFSKIRRP